jgi:spore coat protein CotF
MIETKILKNLWEICKNAHLEYDQKLNQLSNELFYTQTKVISKKIRWFDQTGA